MWGSLDFFRAGSPAPGPSQSAPVSSPSAPLHLPRTSESDQLLRIRHSCSHVMAMAVQRLFRNVKSPSGRGPRRASTTTSTPRNPSPPGSQENPQGDAEDSAAKPALPPGRGEPAGGPAADRGHGRTLQAGDSGGSARTHHPLPPGGSVVGPVRRPPRGQHRRDQSRCRGPGNRGRRLLAGRRDQGPVAAHLRHRL